MILDIISLIIILIFAIIGVKFGGAKVIFRVLSFALSLALAVFLSHFLAELVYNTFIRQTIINNIDSLIADTGLTTAADKAGELISGFPAVLSNALAYFGITQSGIAALFDASAVESLEGLIKTPVVGVISLVFFLILFTVLSIVIKKLFNSIAKIFRLPLIRVVDSAIGFVLGLFEGVLVVYLLVIALKLLIPLTGGNIFFINDAYIAESSLFSLLYFGGISTFVQSFIFSFSNI